LYSLTVEHVQVISDAEQELVHHKCNYQHIPQVSEQEEEERQEADGLELRLVKSVVLDETVEQYVD
jgi:hypothetical protein